MDKFNLEIAGGLGPTAGKVWRVSVAQDSQKYDQLAHCAFASDLRQSRLRLASSDCVIACMHHSFF
jgi:aspartate aminotransferase-like enzyme